MELKAESYNAIVVLEWSLFQKSWVYRLFEIYESPAKALESLSLVEEKSWLNQ